MWSHVSCRDRASLQVSRAQSWGQFRGSELWQLETSCYEFTLWQNYFTRYFVDTDIMIVWQCWIFKCLRPFTIFGHTVDMRRCIPGRDVFAVEVQCRLPAPPGSGSTARCCLRGIEETDVPYGPHRRQTWHIGAARNWLLPKAISGSLKSSSQSRNHAVSMKWEWSDTLIPAWTIQWYTYLSWDISSPTVESWAKGLQCWRS